MSLFIRVLASLNLPAALEDLSGDSIPQSIAEKSRSIVQHGGLQSIEQLIKDLPELLTRNREVLDEVSVGDKDTHVGAQTSYLTVSPDSFKVMYCTFTRAASFPNTNIWTNVIKLLIWTC